MIGIQIDFNKIETSDPQTAIQFINKHKHIKSVSSLLLIAIPRGWNAVYQALSVITFTTTRIQDSQLPFDVIKTRHINLINVKSRIDRVMEYIRDSGATSVYYSGIRGNIYSKMSHMKLGELIIDDSIPRPDILFRYLRRVSCRNLQIHNTRIDIKSADTFIKLILIPTPIKFVTARIIAEGKNLVELYYKFITIRQNMLTLLLCRKVPPRAAARIYVYLGFIN